MSGIYGESDEDKFFENKLLNREEDREVEDSFIELDITIFKVLAAYVDSECSNPVIRAIMDTLVLPILYRLIIEGVSDAKHLKDCLGDEPKRESQIEDLITALNDIKYDTNIVIDRLRKL